MLVVNVVPGRLVLARAVFSALLMLSCSGKNVSTDQEVIFMTSSGMKVRKSYFDDVLGKRMGSGEVNLDAKAAIAARLAYSSRILELAQEAKAPHPTREQDEQVSSKHLDRIGETEETYSILRRAREAEKQLSMLRMTDDAIMRRAHEKYEEVKELYRSESVRISVSEILIPFAETVNGTSDAASDKATQVYQDMSENPSEFESLAKKISSSRSASNGGDIGIFSLETRPKNFPEYLFSRPKSFVSSPSKIEGGYVIYKVNGVFPPGLLPFVAIQQQFFEQAKKELLYSEISRLRADIIDSSSEWLVSGPGMGEMGLKLEDVLRSMKMNVDPLSI